MKFCSTCGFSTVNVYKNVDFSLQDVSYTSYAPAVYCHNCGYLPAPKPFLQKVKEYLLSRVPSTSGYGIAIFFLLSLGFLIGFDVAVIEGATPSIPNTLTITKRIVTTVRHEYKEKNDELLRLIVFPNRDDELFHNRTLKKEDTDWILDSCEQAAIKNHSTFKIIKKYEYSDKSSVAVIEANADTIAQIQRTKYIGYE